MAAAAQEQVQSTVTRVPNLSPFTPHDEKPKRGPSIHVSRETCPFPPPPRKTGELLPTASGAAWAH